MIPTSVNAMGVVLLGCGKMGGALLEGWLADGLAPSSVSVIDPYPSDRLHELEARGLKLNADIPSAPAVAVLAVKPQTIAEALRQIEKLGNGRTVCISIAAGTRIDALEASLGQRTPIVRAMPNTPAAVGKGITALIGNAQAGENALDLAEILLGAVGETVRIEDESQMDAVTAVSGSGPAYVFHLIETLAAAGEAEGLAPELALRLARSTVAGSGILAAQGGQPPETLRKNVTSPGGTTAAALVHLMDEETGLGPLMKRTVAAAAARSRELGD